MHVLALKDPESIDSCNSSWLIVIILAAYNEGTQTQTLFSANAFNDSHRVEDAQSINKKTLIVSASEFIAATPSIPKVCTPAAGAAGLLHVGTSCTHRLPCATA